MPRTICDHFACSPHNSASKVLARHDRRRTKSRSLPLADDLRPVVNPAWRELDRQCRSLKGKFTQRGARFAALALKSESDADVIPEGETKVLEVRIHTLANPRSSRAIEHLLDHLNAAECTYPGTDFQLH